MTKTIEFDGYSFGDRLLEGVTFTADVSESGVENVKVIEDDSDYFSNLNEKKWLRKATDYIKDEIDEYESLEQFLEEYCEEEGTAIER